MKGTEACVGTKVGLVKDRSCVGQSTSWDVRFSLGSIEEGSFIRKYTCTDMGRHADLNDTVIKG